MTFKQYGVAALAAIGAIVVGVWGYHKIKGS